MKARRIRLKELKKQIEDRLAGDEKELEHTKNFLLKIVGEIGDMAKRLLEVLEGNRDLKEKIKSLRGDIDGLASRIEWLEDRGDDE